MHTTDNNTNQDTFTITRQDIEQLQIQAGAHGDQEMVAICDRALYDGDPDAVAECLRVIEDARAMGD